MQLTETVCESTLHLVQAPSPHLWCLCHAAPPTPGCPRAQYPKFQRIPIGPTKCVVYGLEKREAGSVAEVQEDRCWGSESP